MRSNGLMKHPVVMHLDCPRGLKWPILACKTLNNYKVLNGNFQKVLMETFGEYLYTNLYEPVACKSWSALEKKAHFDRITECH